MPDIRVKCVKFIEERQMSITLNSTIPFTAISIAGFILEINNIECNSKIRVWLIGSVIRAWLRCFMISLPSQSINNAMNKLKKASIECLDVVGAVWFVLMTLAILSSDKCINKIPITYISCVIFLLGTLLYIIIYYSLLISLSCSLPTDTEDRQYLLERRQRSSSNDIPLDDQNETALQGERLNLTRTFWKTWLEKYNCYEFHYEKDILLYANNSGNAGDSSGINDNIYDSTNNNSSSNSSSRSIDIDNNTMNADIELGQIHIQHTTTNTTTTVENDEQNICVICLSPFVAIDKTGSLEVGNTILPHNTNTVVEYKDNDIDELPTHSYHNTTSTNTTTNQYQQCLQTIEVNTIPTTTTTNNTNNTTNNTSNEIDNTNNSSPEMDNSLIIRYPCNGNHYFHAHCLYHWLQVNVTSISQSSQYNNTMSAITNRDFKNYVTCPVCRQKPTATSNKKKTVTPTSIV